MSKDSISSGVRSLPAAVRDPIAAGELPPGTDLAVLRMAEKPGQLAGRQVTYFRVFDSEKAARKGLDAPSFEDLDDHLDVVLRSGHIESDGTVVMNHGWPVGVRQLPG